MIVLATCVALLMIHQGEGAKMASAVLYGDGSTKTYGTLTFTQNDASSPVLISGLVTSLNASSAHGFHVHVYPVSEGSPNCTAAGPHFNPYNVTHGPISGTLMTRHVGDLGNLTTDTNGNVNVNVSDSIIQLYNETQSINGRTVIIHLMRDDGGMGGFADSATTGNAGARIICGLIKSSALKTTPTLIGLLMTAILLLMKIH